MYQDVPLFSLTGLLGCAGAMLLAPFPDVDEPNSVPAKGAFPLAWICELLRVRHRTVTHSVLFCYSLLFLIHHLHPHWFGMSWNLIFLTWWWGYISHPLVDLLNTQGVEILWPLKLRFNLLPPGLGIGVGSKTEERIQTMLMFVITFVVFLWFFRTTPMFQHVFHVIWVFLKDVYALFQTT